LAASKAAKKLANFGNKSAAGKGRKKGAVNRTTKSAREQFTKLVEMNLDNATEWLQRVARKDPARAFDLLLRASEFVLPKLTRSEFHGPGGQPLPAGTVQEGAQVTIVNQAVLTVSKDDGLSLYREMMNGAAPDKPRLEAPGLPSDSRLASGEAAVVAGRTDPV